jgi:hypothetical protein
VKKPRFFAVQFEYQFVANPEVAYCCPIEFTNYLIVVSRYVSYPGAGRGHINYLFYHFQMDGREVALPKLPGIHNVSVQNQCARFDAAQVSKEFLGMAAECPQVYIGYYGYLYFSFFQEDSINSKHKIKPIGI